MIISLGFYRRRRDITHEQFLDHWKNVHGVMASDLPGADEFKMKYVQHHLQRDPGDGHHPRNSTDLLFDGFSESWYRSMDDRAAYFQLSGMRDAMRRDEAEFIDMSATRWMVLDNPVTVIDRTQDLP